MKHNIEEEYTAFYKKKKHVRVYPSEYVVRTFLAEYPGLNMKKPSEGDTVIDVSCGDGRNLLFLCQQGYHAFGTEISEKICYQTKERIEINGYSADVRVGKNHTLPFENSFADYILAAYSMYYCDEGITFADNLKEYARVLKPGGWVISAILHEDSALLSGADKLDDGTFIVRNDPYNNRNGYRLYAVASREKISDAFSPYFENFSFAHEHNDFYGVDQNIFWVVGQKRGN